MSTEPPPDSGPPPENDPLRKHPPPGQSSGSPHDVPDGGQQPPPGQEPPPYSQPPPGGAGPHGASNPYGGSSYPADPLAGMPPLAQSGKRTLARIIDLILVGIVVWLLTWPMGVHEYSVDGGNIEYGKSFAQSVVGAVLYIAYDTFMISSSGQTLGKKWLNMRVANLNDGSTPSVQTSLARAAVLWIPFAFCCACIWTAICGGWSYFDRPYKQGLHDKAAKTVVVSTR
ncbi:MULTISPECIES: RDD family protein [unclassified Streptomyces]|uniref:RDD family protein n=1 Tax=unclassified Streptomyces TaxID=2593676 RepID=UPI000D38ABE6|nr:MULTISPECIES: RDD family protein [unclassified Streptomyces]PTM91120.1 putative RDD family membrane protein YckC [Streptomyces sp. VMFN-G11Ma]